MSELKVTYRGIDVPEVYYEGLFRSSALDDWRSGVDSTLGVSESEATPPLREITDGEGDVWFEVEPGVFRIIPSGYSGSVDEYHAARPTRVSVDKDHIESMYGIRSERPRVQ